VQKKTVAMWVVAILVISVLVGLIAVRPNQSNEQPQKTTMQNIIINPDGSITPSDVPIQQIGNVYRLTNNIYGTIKILKSDIVLNGAGHTLSGPYNGSQANVWVVGDGPNQSPDLIAEWVIGIDFGENVDGTVIQNIDIKNFSIGMYVWTENNTVSSCKIYDSIVGILLSGENNTVTYNYIENNTQGLFMGFNNEGNTTIPPDILIHHNDFENNEIQLNGCSCKSLNRTETPHHWDDGKEGNYWSDYNGTDANKDNIGDTPYVVDELNIDRYPMIISPYQLIENVLAPHFDPVIIAFAFVFLILITCLLLLAIKKMKR
jgi:hypothetical protein